MLHSLLYNIRKRYQTDVWELLRRNISRGQILGYALANIVGLSVILIGVLFYCDSQHNNSQEDKYFSNEYIVISKKVDGISFGTTYFSEEEIQLISKQPWAKKVGRFTSSQFAVNGSVTMGGKTLSTYLFFESVPDEFFDIKPKGWKFSPVEKRIPIILCKDYLTLYNFGFAIPQGLPQVSEEIIGSIPIVLQLTGKDMKTEYFDASIVGFSSRLNTIAVPQSFMDWANSHYSDKKEVRTSRLIVEADRLSSPSEIKKFMKEHEIEIAGDKEKTGKISRFLGVVSAVVTSNGVVICVLAMFILILSIYLLLQKSQEKLRYLMLLGYHPMYIAKYYETIVVVSNVAITLLSLIITVLSRFFWEDGLDEIGLGNASCLPTMITAIVYVVGITLLDICIIRKHIKQIWCK